MHSHEPYACSQYAYLRENQVAAVVGPCTGKYNAANEHAAIFQIKQTC